MTSGHAISAESNTLCSGSLVSSAKLTSMVIKGGMRGKVR